MRLAIVGTVLAFALTGAYAQAPAPKLQGDKAFCLKSTDKIDCSFDSAAACEKGMQAKSKDSTSGGSCVTRMDAMK